MAEPWLPLKGIRVLDFSWQIAGPLSTRFLANFGAEVLKVESYSRVDRVRETGPHPEGPWSLNEDGSFNDVNSGKKSILLNFNQPEARQIALRLAAISDIAAANFTGDRLDRWGLGFDDLARVKPDLVMLSMPVFEPQGKRARWGGYGSHINALAGINAISGREDQPPFGLGPLYPDFSANPWHAVATILAALLNRPRAGGAQLIEIAQFESTARILGPATLDYAVNGREPPRLGNRSLRSAPCQVYRCRGEDRWLAVEVKDDAQWQAFCRALGHAEWAADARFASFTGRKTNEDALDAMVGAATANEDAPALAARLIAAGLAASPVNDLRDVLSDSWYMEQHYQVMTGPEGCEFTSHGEVVRGGPERQPLRLAPLMGEHTDQVLRELLGLDEGEINALYASGALG